MIGINEWIKTISFKKQEWEQSGEYDMTDGINAVEMYITLNLICEPLQYVLTDMALYTFYLGMSLRNLEKLHNSLKIFSQCSY